MRDYLDIPFKIKAVSEDGLFSGYGSVFNVVDSYNEVVTPGAFTESLRADAVALVAAPQRRAGRRVYGSA